MSDTKPTIPSSCFFIGIEIPQISIKHYQLIALIHKRIQITPGGIDGIRIHQWEHPLAFCVIYIKRDRLRLCSIRDLPSDCCSCGYYRNVIQHVALGECYSSNYLAGTIWSNNQPAISCGCLFICIEVPQISIKCDELIAFSSFTAKERIIERERAIHRSDIRERHTNVYHPAGRIKLIVLIADYVCGFNTEAYCGAERQKIWVRVQGAGARMERKGGRELALPPGGGGYSRSRMRIAPMLG